MSPRLELQVDREQYAPGETVTGNVTVAEGGRSRKLEVSLRYREKAEDDYEHTAVTLPGGELHTGDLVEGASYPFAIALPGDALPGYASAHGELHWELEARSDELGVDTRECRRVVVSVRPPDAPAG